MPDTKHRLYRILVGAELDSTWNEWFYSLELHPNPDGTTLLTGIMDDQVLLHTTLNKIRNLNIDLISVQYEELTSEKGESDETDD